MENNKMPDFKDSRSLFESAALCAAAATILRIGFGEACSCYSRCVNPVLIKVKPEKLAKDFSRVIDYLKKCHDDFVGSAHLALKAERGESSDNRAESNS